MGRQVGRQQRREYQGTSDLKGKWERRVLHRAVKGDKYRIRREEGKRGMSKKNYKQSYY